MEVGMGAMKDGLKQLGPSKWWVVARVRKNGRVVHRERTIEGTKEAAKSLREVLKRKIREEGKVPGSSLISSALKTFKDILLLYKEKRGPFSRACEALIKTLVTDLGDIPLNMFPDRFEQYIRILRSTKSKRKKLRSSQAINRPIQVVKAAYNLVVALGLVESNPITKYRFPKLPEIPRDVTLSNEEKGRLLDLAQRETPHLEPILRFALQVPCRKSELVNMTRKDLDLDSNVIRVRCGTTKNDAGIWKPIPPGMVGYFRELPKETEYLFFRQDKNGYHCLGDFKKAWKRLRKLAGCEHVHFHDTRHMSATDLVDRGTPERVVMAVAGWRTNMLRTYYHREPKKELELVQWGTKCEGFCKGPQQRKM